MRIFSLLLAIFFYVIPLFLYLIMFVSQILKKHKLTFIFLVSYFISIFISIAIISWALVIMNGNFKVNVHITIDYSWLIIFLIIMIGINVLWFFIFMKKNKYLLDKNESGLIKTVSFFFPVVLSVTLTLITGLIYFVFNYYLYLSEMKLWKRFLMFL